MHWGGFSRRDRGIRWAIQKACHAVTGPGIVMVLIVIVIVIVSVTMIELWWTWSCNTLVPPLAWRE